VQERNLAFWDEDEWKQITGQWPTAIQRGFATKLRVVQLGGQPAANAKPLRGFNIPLWEIYHRDGQRVIYTTEYCSLTNLVHVIDAFEKDSRKGRKMRTSDKHRITGRVQRLQAEMKPLQASAIQRQRLH
jgi:phage-related protein